MFRILPDFNEEIPRWDVALEALMREEYVRKRRPLLIEDIWRLAEQYMIRFDDLMATLFELAVHRRWQYRNDRGVVREFNRADVDRFCSGGRLEAADIPAFIGDWRPLD